MFLALKKDQILNLMAMVTNPRPLTPPYVPLLLPSRLGFHPRDYYTLPGVQK